MKKMIKAVSSGACALMLGTGASVVLAQTPTAQMPASADSRFMADAAAGGTMELELSRLATERASRPEIKSLAQMLVDDHTMVSAELTELAARKGVTLPAQPSADHIAERDRLAKLSGPQFDEAYLKAMTKGHEKSVALFSKESSTGADADAKAWATKVLPKLQGHLAKVKDLGPR